MLNLFKEEELAIDAVITSGFGSNTVRIKAHRLVLAASIPYLKGLFYQSPSPPPDLEIPIQIDGVDNPAVIKSIIEWAYSGEIVIENDTVNSC